MQRDKQRLEAMILTVIFLLALVFLLYATATHGKPYGNPRPNCTHTR